HRQRRPFAAQGIGQPRTIGRRAKTDFLVHDRRPAADIGRRRRRNNGTILTRADRKELRPNGPALACPLHGALAIA
ncbi:MAG TPA: hypothetical protein VFL51_10120, partial [Pseudolabrys sp.]|nr:hypothetical protein [Pseudolabrys sp.]